LVEQHAAHANGNGCTLYGRGAKRLADVPCTTGAIGLRVAMPMEDLLATCGPQLPCGGVILSHCETLWSVTLLLAKRCVA
jgi:hypothetical protein